MKYLKQKIDCKIYVIKLINLINKIKIFQYYIKIFVIKYNFLYLHIK